MILSLNEKYQYLITNLKFASNIEFIQMCCLMLWESQQDLNLIDQNNNNLINQNINNMILYSHPMFLWFFGLTLTGIILEILN